MAGASSESESIYDASSTGDVRTVRRLLRMDGIDVNDRDPERGLPALHYASWNGRTEVVTCLLQHPAINANAADRNSRTALHYASQQGHTEVVECLLQHRAINVNAADSEPGATALHLASIFDHTEVVKCLLRHPAINVNAANSELGATALHLASIFDHTEVVKCLLQHPAINVNAADGSCETALHYVSQRGHTEVVKCLLQHPAIDVNAVNSRSGETALHVASREGHLEVVECLLQHPAIDVNLENLRGRTALHDASIQGHMEVVKLLLPHGANVMNQRDGQTDVHRAADSGHRRPFLPDSVFNGRWELNHDDVRCIEEIGKGHFGVVHRAFLHSRGMTVAVKTCRVDLPEEQTKFLREARILQQYNHPNVVRLVGICVRKQPIMIVMEYIRRGSLLDYLQRHHETLSNRHLFKMSGDCAAGMAYLESRGCIHRDLAARNCLVDEHYVKISDFGLSREGDRYYLTQGLNQIPFKWTAPEALHYGRYTSKCDVWSFGVLVWEVFSLGRIPYPTLTNTEVLNEIDQGYRLPAPDRIPSDLYELILMCWEKDPELRPDFDRIHKLFRRVTEYLCRQE